MAIEAPPFSKLFRARREELGWSQDKAARELEVTKTTVQAWESGKSEPRFAQLLRVCDSFGWALPFLTPEDPTTARKLSRQSLIERLAAGAARQPAA